MNRFDWTRAIMVLFGTLLILAPPAFGDGVHIPPKAADLRIPGIPNQQALIVHRNGVEKLYVQSTVDGNGGELAWIVPVPAEPTEVAEAGRGILVALPLATTPVATDRGSITVLALGFFLTVWAVYLLAAPRFAPWAAFLMAALACLCMALSGNLLRSRSASPSAVAGMEVSKAQTVGNYTVQTLKADTPQALDQWLDENGFRGMPEKGRPVVEDYIRNGWRFVAVKLHQDAAGPLRPHPLAITFPAKEAVYPMRLTQLAGTDLLLDLYVISDDFVRVPGMETIYADRYQGNAGYGYDGVTYRRYLDFPAFADLAGKECVLTRLHEVLKNRDLDHDYTIKPGGGPVYKRFYTRQGVWGVSIQWALLCAGLVLLFGAFLVHLRPTLFGKRPPRTMVALVGVVVFAVMLLMIRTAIPTTPVSHSVGFGRGSRIVDLAFEFSREYKQPTGGTSLQTIQRDFVDYVQQKGYRLPYSDEPFRLEECPGSAVIVENSSHQYVIRAYAHGFSCGCQEFDLFPARL